MGFIGVTHIDAIRRINSVDLMVVSDVNYELPKRKAEKYGISKCFSDMESLISDPDIQVVHNCTPNHMHFDINEKIIRAGKHIF